MKTLLSGCLALGLGLPCLFAQNFVKVNDPNNPVTNFTVVPVHLYVGAAWIDYDNDGDIDLFAAPNRLFENLGAGKFQGTSTQIGSGMAASSWPYAGVSWADVDNDGDIDCMLAYVKSRLYLNNGAGAFQPYTQLPLNANNTGWAAALGDYNADGFVDIAIAKPDVNPGEHGWLFTSAGKLAWESKTGLAFTDNPAPYTVPCWADFDDDGDYDLFVASGPAVTPPAKPDYIYRNNLTETGTPGLQALTGIPFAGAAQDGQLYNFIDYDNDGRLDICLSNYVYAPNRLYHNNGDGTYTSVSTAFTAASLTNSLSNAWGDFNNDGNLDVIITRDGALAARFYLDDGAGNFQLQAANPVSQQIDATGASIGDYDNDGDLDVFLNGRTDEAGSGRALFRNDGLAGSNHWVSFKLIGTQSNRSAIGAKVRIKVTIGGQSKWLRRDVSAQNTFQGQNDLRVHFGLGDAAVIDSLSIRFPSGAVTTCSGVPADQFYTVTETDGPWDLCTTPASEVLQNKPCNSRQTRPLSRSASHRVPYLFRTGPKLKFSIL